MNAVRATVRLQLHAEFPFDAAAQQAPYLARLGASHLYLSPILTARSGSRHGYDVVDHRAINPELGGEAGFRHLAERARALDLGVIVDIVPNHMAVGSDNAWWMDVLAWGRDSPFARFFDIDWDVPDPALRGRLLAPFLGKPYGEALAAGEIRLALDATAGRFEARCYEHRFPIAPREHAPLLQDAGLAPLAAAFRAAIAQRRTAQRAAVDDAARALARAATDPAAAPALAAVLQAHDPAEAAGRARLHRLLERQPYRLAWWHTAHDEINWRRFFDLADYAGLRVEEPAVFEATHATVLRLYGEGLIDGVRVDHVDGLADPRAYCRKLRQRLTALTTQRPPALRSAPYIVVEKILAPGERLQPDWRVDGTTGYSFMNDVNALLHDPAGETPLTSLWTGLTGRAGDFAVEERAARRRIVDELLSADFNATALALHRIARGDPATRDVTLGAIRRVLLELLVHFPVYRIYADRRGRTAADAGMMEQVRAAARAACRPADRPFVDLVDRWLGGEPPAAAASRRARELRLRAITRFQQLSSPLAAKAVEDTAFYRHGRLLSRNEVGADPRQFSVPSDDFHAEAQRRQRHFPRALLATATHDHKRGEDARARLAVLSEIAERWGDEVQSWFALNAERRQPLPGGVAPAPADEYMLYQTLVGHWPLDLAPDAAPALRAWGERVVLWYRKAVREAKLRSSWVEPDLAYEDACRAFALGLLDPAAAGGAPGRIAAFVDGIASAGAANALAQTLLRLTAPGVPDLYQGTEFWDFSLVDPDNRQPVDYPARQRALEASAHLPALIDAWRDGRLKQHLIARALALRAAQPELFGAGAYVPLPAAGPAARHVLAFARVHGTNAAIAVTARWCAGQVDRAVPRIGPAHWQDTQLALPAALAARCWRSVLGGGTLDGRGRWLPVATVLDGLPVGLLHSAGPPH